MSRNSVKYQAKVRKSDDGSSWLDLSLKLDPRVNAKGNVVYFYERYAELPVEVNGADLDMICTIMSKVA